MEFLNNNKNVITYDYDLLVFSNPKPNMERKIKKNKKKLNK